MIIGVPKEIKDNEYRVAITPAGVQMLKDVKCEVIVEKNAGVGSGFSNEEYIKEGAIIGETSKEVYDKSELILKVKEPLPKECDMLREEQTVFAFFHLVSSKELTKNLLEKKVTCIAYETIQTKEFFLPILAPMSEIAGRMSVLEGAECLKNINGGKGILLSGLPGVAPAKVIIIGGGVAGFNATMMASNMGALVTVMDTNINKLREIDKIAPKNVVTVIANAYEIKKRIEDVDLVITAALNRGQRAPLLITREMLKCMQPGSVVVDISIDQGGCLETSKPTTHSEPTFIKEGIVHYCVTNIPGVIGRTATYALTNATLPFVIEIAHKGVKRALRENRNLAEGLNIMEGKITLKAIADYYGMLSHSKKRLLS